MLLMNRIILLILIFAIGNSSYSQRTVGLISYKPWKAFEGYNLIYPHNQSDVFLLNNCGEIVHKWDGEDDTRPGNTAYILENGNLVKTSRSSNIMGDPIWAGGGGATVEIRSWENELLWSYTLNNDTARLHHDIAILPNGNIAMIAWELKTEEEAIEAGRNPDLIANGEVWSEMILEVDPQTDEVVWEWKAWDHLIQDYDETKANFGIIGDNPERINLNYDSSEGSADWLHMNSLDHDPMNDQLLISVPTFDEVWVIDHFTTTEEAASSTGGFAGKGGDLLYRWGNNAAYDQGTLADKKLFYQHDAQFIDDFLSPAHPLFGKFAAFNNRIGEDFSSVVVWNNTYDMYNASFEKDGSIFTPLDYDFNRLHPENPQAMYSTGLSSVQILPNNNWLVTDGRNGYSFELTPDDEIVWEYITPLKGGVSVPQFTELETNNNLTFRMKRYPADFEGFAGKTLEGTDYLELDGDPSFCNQILPIEMTYDNDLLKVYPNPAKDVLTIEWESMANEKLQIIDIVGHVISEFERSGGRIFLDVHNYEQGYYFVRTSRGATKKFIIVR